MHEAAAKHAREGPLDVAIGWTGIRVDERLDCQNDATQAETALRGLLVDERLLERVWLVDGPESLAKANKPAGWSG